MLWFLLPFPRYSNAQTSSFRSFCGFVEQPGKQQIEQTVAYPLVTPSSYQLTTAALTRGKTF